MAVQVCKACGRPLDRRGGCPAHGPHDPDPTEPYLPRAPQSGLTVNPAADKGFTGAEPGRVYDDPEADLGGTS